MLTFCNDNPCISFFIYWESKSDQIRSDNLQETVQTGISVDLICETNPICLESKHNLTVTGLKLCKFDDHMLLTDKEFLSGKIRFGVAFTFDVNCLGKCEYSTTLMIR